MASLSPFTLEQLNSDQVSKKDLVTFLQANATPEFQKSHKLNGIPKNIIKAKTKDQLIADYQELLAMSEQTSVTSPPPQPEPQPVAANPFSPPSAVMDDLSAMLAGSFQVTYEPNTVSAQHPRYTQYKQHTPKHSQKERRQRQLDEQKKKRFDYQSHVRRLVDDDWHDMEEEEEEEAEKEEEKDEVMEVEYGKLRRPGKHYRNQLMMSEWLVDVPEDLSLEWCMVLCPVGKRNLVVASNGRTTSWSKGGWKCNTFPSALPGGSKIKGGWRRDATVLDCIYNEFTKTYYILDMMCWANQPIMDSETEFRFYWAHTKISENPECGKITRTNPYRFEVLPNFACSKENIENVLSRDTNIPLDGLLFFHKRTHYLFGTTPLVLWLKAYMVPDILNVNVCKDLMKTKPPQYTTFDAHIQKVKDDKIKETEKEDKRKNRRRSGNKSMDTSTSSLNTSTSSNTKTPTKDFNVKEGADKQMDFQFSPSSTEPAQVFTSPPNPGVDPNPQPILGGSVVGSVTILKNPLNAGNATS